MEPVLLKTLRLLRETREFLTEKDIAERIDEAQAYVTKALEELSRRNMLGKSGELYHYDETSINEAFFQRIAAVFDKIGRRSEGQLVTIGWLAAASQHRYFLRRLTLLKLLEEEGFDAKDISAFLEKESRAGRIARLRVAMVSREESAFTAPPAFSLHHLSHDLTGANEYEKLKRKCVEEGFCVHEEDYLLADFPPDMAETANEYVNKEMPRLRERLRNEVFQYWYGFGSWRDSRR